MKIHACTLHACFKLESSGTVYYLVNVEVNAMMVPQICLGVNVV